MYISLDKIFRGNVIWYLLPISSANAKKATWCGIRLNRKSINKVSMKNLGFFPLYRFDCTWIEILILVFYFSFILRPKKEKKNDTNTAIVIAIIVCVLLAVTVTFIVIVVVVRKRHQKDSRRRQPLEIAKQGKNYWFERTISNNHYLQAPKFYKCLNIFISYAHLDDKFKVIYVNSVMVIKRHHCFKGLRLLKSFVLNFYFISLYQNRTLKKAF